MITPRPRSGGQPMTIAHLHVWDRKNKGDVAIVEAVQEALRSRFRGCRILDFSVSLLKEGKASDLKKINSADLVVIGGGGLFYSYFLPYRTDFIEGIKPPIIIFGVGHIREIGAPELSGDAAQSVALLARRAALVGVRDDQTKEFLIKNGLAASRVSVIGDPAALLEEKKPEKFKIGPAGQAWRIGLNLNYSGWLGFGKWREDILDSYRAVAAYFLEKGRREGRTVEIYYLKHHPGEKNIYPELGIPGMRLVDLKPAEQKYAYGRLDLVIGMMLHAGVLAFGAGTPEISVAYDLRNYSFAEFIGCPELVVDLEKLRGGELLRRTEGVFLRRENYRKKFGREKAKIAKRQETFLAKAARLRFGRVM